MHFSLSTIATTALILTAAEAIPHRSRGGRPHGTGASGIAFPTGGFDGERGPGGRGNRTEGGRGGRGRPSGSFPSGSFPFPSGGFPSGGPGGFPSGFPSDGPGGFPSGLPSDLPSNFPGLPTETALPSGPAVTSPPSLPTDGAGLGSVSFEFPSTIQGNINAAADEDSSATPTAPSGTTPTGSTGSGSNGTSTFIPSSGAATTTFPQAAGESTLSEPMVVTGEFDGGMVRFGRGVDCSGQSEGGDSDAVFQIEEGGTLKNVIIGADQSEGVHCMGACTIENVWWEAVCEDALTIKQESGVSYVIGGGAKGAEDKVIQHNGGGTVSVSGFYVSDFGKLYRSCGNCKTMYERHVILDNIIADGGSATLVGINSNYKDTATITNSCVTNTKVICTEFEGNDTGDEPTEISEGISSACIYTDADVAAC